MAPMGPRLAAATLLFNLLFCDDHSPTCPRSFERKVGETVEIKSCSESKGITEAYWKYGKEKIADFHHVRPSRFDPRLAMNKTTFNLILSSLTLQDSGKFGFFSAKENKQLPTVFFNLSIYEPIANVSVRKINSTWDSIADKCEIWLECTVKSGSSVNYTWAIGNETHTGATFKHVTPKAENTGKCAASNPVSKESTSIWLECSNITRSEVRREHQDTTFQPIWIYSSAGLAVLVLVLVLVLVCRLKRSKAAPEATDTVYDSIENVQMKMDEETLGPLYEIVNNGVHSPRPQETGPSSIYYTVQHAHVTDPPS